MILSGVRQLCLLSVFCGAAMSLCPKGSIKQVLAIGCAAVLTLSLMNAWRESDLSAYTLELARYAERKEEFLTDSKERTERLNRLVIEEQYGAYIMAKAREYGLEIQSVQVQVQWSMEGFWMPWSVRVSCTGDELSRQKLRDSLVTDLGIPVERQAWE